MTRAILITFGCFPLPSFFHVVFRLSLEAYNFRRLQEQRERIGATKRKRNNEGVSQALRTTTTTTSESAEINDGRKKKEKKRNYVTAGCSFCFFTHSFTLLRVIRILPRKASSPLLSRHRRDKSVGLLMFSSEISLA